MKKYKGNCTLPKQTGNCCADASRIFKQTKSFMMGVVTGSTLSTPTKHYLLRLMEDIDQWEVEELDT